MGETGIGNFDGKAEKFEEKGIERCSEIGGGGCVVYIYTFS